MRRRNFFVAPCIELCYVVNKYECFVLKNIDLFNLSLQNGEVLRVIYIKLAYISKSRILETKIVDTLFALNYSRGFFFIYNWHSVRNTRWLPGFLWSCIMLLLRNWGGGVSKVWHMSSSIHFWEAESDF